MKFPTLFLTLASGFALASQIHADNDFKPLIQPKEVRSVNGILSTTIAVEESTFSNSFISFNTRSYNSSFPGPTLRVSPGDRVVIRLVNRLVATKGDKNGFNSTNLHFHGLNIPPTGRGDNMNIAVKPQKSYTYDFFIPEDHSTGTFWYHNHFHGNMNSQQLGLMAGAFIVEDKKETLDVNLSKMDDHIMLLQGICSHGCENEWDNLVYGIPNLHPPEEEEAKGSTNGKLRFLAENTQHNHEQEESSPSLNLNLKHFGKFPRSETAHNHIIVNGQLSPVVKMVPNQYTRLRIIQGMANAISEIVIPGCEMAVIARDGVYKERPQKLNTVIVPSGSRADLLVKCPEGKFYMKNIPDKKRDAIIGTKMRIQEQEFTVLEVSQPDLTSISLPKIPSYLSDAVPKSNEIAYQVEFTMYAVVNGEEPEHGVNFRTFDKKYFNHTMYLEESELWQVHSNPSHNCESWNHLRPAVCPKDKEGHYAHPFHTHTNHYKIVAKSKPERDVDGERFEIGEWRDTIPVYDETITILIKPRRYTGLVLLHCHFGEHGDDGMSQNVNITTRDQADQQPKTTRDQADQQPKTTRDQADPKPKTTRVQKNQKPKKPKGKAT